MIKSTAEYIVTTSPILRKAMLRRLNSSGNDFTILKEFNNGIYLIRCETLENPKLKEAISSACRYIKHIFEVDFKTQATNDLENDVSTIKKYINCKNFSSDDLFSVQVRNLNNSGYTAKDLEVALGSYIETAYGAKAFFDDKKIPQDFSQKILSILIFDKELYAGLGRTEDNLYPVSDPYRIFSRWKTHICRSEFKLREALQVIGYEAKSGTIAVDLGAAPGGWSFVLAEYGMRVTAVDPAKLDSRLLEMPNVTHYKGKAQDFKTEEPIGLLVNDMNMEPKESAGVVSSFSRNLPEQAMVIMTIKLVSGPYGQRIQEVLDILKKDFRLVCIRLLFHNRQEVTAFFEKHTNFLIRPPFS